VKLFYAARNILSRRLFSALREYCRGNVLDVGGWGFYRTASRRGIRFDHWTILEYGAGLTDKSRSEVTVEYGNGCDMKYPPGSFDTVLNIQVLEHVFSPNLMIAEMCRVLRPGGNLIMLIPQTSTLHMVPNHYYNFTRFWIEEAMRRNGMEVLELVPLGGVWRSMASHLIYAVFQAMRTGYVSPKEIRRPLLFYPLLPLMLAFTLAAVPACLLFSLGDLEEEANNHLVVARKPIAEATQ